MAKSDLDKEIDRYVLQGLLLAERRQMKKTGATKCPDCGMQLAKPEHLDRHMRVSICASRRLKSKRTKRKSKAKR